jgi:hypothetical protein
MQTFHVNGYEKTATQSTSTSNGPGYDGTCKVAR